jgi:hypothetical protein
MFAVFANSLTPFATGLSSLIWGKFMRVAPQMGHLSALASDLFLTLRLHSRKSTRLTRLTFVLLFHD